MRLGDAWRFRTAGVRALAENGNVAWIGGIADLATRFMRRTCAPGQAAHVVKGSREGGALG